MAQGHTSSAHVELTPTTTPKAVWTGPTDSAPSEYVLKEGKSKFYMKSTDNIDKLTDDELEYDDQTVDTDTASQTSIETTATIPAKDVLDQNPSK